MVDLLLDVLAPAACPLCGSQAARGPTRFCRRCARTFRAVASPLCTCCGVPFAAAMADHPCGACVRQPPAFGAVRAGGRYEGGLLDSIHRLKFAGDIVQITALALLLVRALRRLPRPHASRLQAAPSPHHVVLDARPPYDLVVPVPLHPRRIRERGFNQAHLLAAALLRGGRLASWAELAPDALIRTRETTPQTRLTRIARQSNLRGAFRGRAERVRGRHVLLVDDVMTTGATLDACARALRRAGARRIDAVVTARAVAWSGEEVERGDRL
ncbi:MAG: phosphoribosyltransferase family protein [Deltaproteobacteria bacterium]|nr:phosphoribosyltransferase family protein [Deltaproteobacteria bacterium]